MEKNFKEIANLFENAHIFRKFYARKEFKELQVKPKQFPILNYVYNNPGCTQVEIASELYISPASVAISTKRLQKSGILEKEVDENSLRTNRVTLTDLGKSIVERSRILMRNTDAVMFTDFTDEELATLRCYLKRMVRNLAGEEGENLTPLTRTAFKNKIKMEEEIENGGDTI